MPQNQRHIAACAALLALPSLPLAIYFLPRAMVLMPEPGDPWYAKYTTIPWLVINFYMAPANAAAAVAGIKFLTAGHFVICILYTLLLGYLFMIVHRHNSRHNHRLQSTGDARDEK